MFFIILQSATCFNYCLLNYLLKYDVYIVCCSISVSSVKIVKIAENVKKLLIMSKLLIFLFSFPVFCRYELADKNTSS